ncbi:MAG: outer membrane lipoprotein-sorting protein [Acidobacteria bacterium]|nr:outer membrane lipoprotein-sorting protein [Acidobacteriota bacterium]
MNRLVAALCVAAPCLAQDARQIVELVQRRAEVKSERYEGTLQVFDARGRTTEKRWRYDRLGSAGASKVVLRFTAPAEVKGVALLVFNHPDRASDQWMWTPAIQRDRRIALQDRSTRFFGTDFSFEDLEEHETGQYDYKMLGEEALDGAPCWKIESRPKRSRSSQYTHSHLWVRQESCTFARIESFVKDQLARRLNYSNLERVQGIWTPRRLEMHDLRRNSRTVLTLEKLTYNLPLKEEDFTLLALRRES